MKINLYSKECSTVHRALERLISEMKLSPANAANIAADPQLIPRLLHLLTLPTESPIIATIVSGAAKALAVLMQEHPASVAAVAAYTDPAYTRMPIYVAVPRLANLLRSADPTVLSNALEALIILLQQNFYSLELFVTNRAYSLDHMINLLESTDANVINNILGFSILVMQSGPNNAAHFARRPRYVSRLVTLLGLLGIESPIMTAVVGGALKVLTILMQQHSDSIEQVAREPSCNTRLANLLQSTDSTVLEGALDVLALLIPLNFADTKLIMSEPRYLSRLVTLLGLSGVESYAIVAVASRAAIVLGILMRQYPNITPIVTAQPHFPHCAQNVVTLLSPENSLPTLKNASWLLLILIQKHPACVATVATQAVAGNHLLILLDSPNKVITTNSAVALEILQSRYPNSNAASAVNAQIWRTLNELMPQPEPHEVLPTLTVNRAYRVVYHLTHLIKISPAAAVNMIPPLVNSLNPLIQMYEIDRVSSMLRILRALLKIAIAHITTAHLELMIPKLTALLAEDTISATDAIWTLVIILEQAPSCTQYMITTPHCIPRLVHLLFSTSFNTIKYAAQALNLISKNQTHPVPNLNVAIRRVRTAMISTPNQTEREQARAALENLELLLPPVFKLCEQEK